MRTLLSAFRGVAAAIIPALIVLTGAGAQAQNKFAAEVAPQIGHADAISAVAISPDGRFALSGSFDYTLRLWDVATGKELRSFTGHTYYVNSVAFSPDGLLALSGSQDGGLKLWELATGKELRNFDKQEGSIYSVAFSPDGRFALSGASETLKLWEVATGKELRSWPIGSVDSVAFSADGRFALSGGFETLKLWELATGNELRSFRAQGDRIFSVAFSPDGFLALSAGSEKLSLWEVSGGKELRTWPISGVVSVAFSPDGRFILSGGTDGMRLWDLATGRELRSWPTAGLSSVVFSPYGRFALSDGAGATMKLWELSTAKELRSYGGHTGSVWSVAIEPGGRFVLTGGCDEARGLLGCTKGSAKLWDAATGKELRSFSGNTGNVYSVAFSRDGQFALTGGCEEPTSKESSSCMQGSMKLWEVATGKELRNFAGHTGDVTWVAFSPDDHFVLSGSNDATVKLWELATGKQLRSWPSDGVTPFAFRPDGRFDPSRSANGARDVGAHLTGKELRSWPGRGVNSAAFSPDGKLALSVRGDEEPGSGELILSEVATGKRLRSFRGHAEPVGSVAFSPDGRFALSGSDDKTLKLWEVATGKELRTFSGHTGWVRSVGFSRDSHFAFSGSQDGTARIWDVKTGKEIARLMASRSDEWLTITPKGFFTASQRDTDMLAIVRGLEVTTIGQVHQSLFSPDLVREALAGDPDGEVKRAAEVINLGKVLDSGPAPFVEITSNTPGSQSVAGLVTVAARVTDRGKGIGRIEWRVNGVTAGVMGAPAGAGPEYEVKQTLALDPGENKIEVIAYNARNLLASLPAQTSIAYTGPADRVKPKLHILAIGIDAYTDNGWTPPGTTRTEYFPPLNLAVADATAFAAEMKNAAAGLYSEVRVRTALDTQATSAGLDRIVEDMSAEIGPRDTFVLFAAAHGISHEGRFYLIPQDYQGGPNPAALASLAIGQERLQEWVANRIKAKKAIILLDTCESGALTNGYTRSRVDAPASEAGVGRLHEATGRPVLTAAAAGHEALELTKLGHGVFTSALIDALYHGDSNGNGLIEVSELAAHVQDLVPKLVAGGEGRSAVAKRGAGGDSQSAHFGSTGEDFTFAKRLP